MKLQAIIITAFLSIVFTQCKSSKQAKEASITEEKTMKLETQTDIQVEQVYFQKWVAGQESGGSGINIFFPKLTNKNNYKLEKVYFRGMIGVMQSGKASYFSNLKKANTDINMTNEEHGEYGNTMPTKPEPFPFELKDSECVISYIYKDDTKYFQVNNIVEKAGEYYPSTPPKQNKD